MKKLLLLLTGVMICAQLATLNLPKLNGDEAIYMLILGEFRKLLTGQGFSLNPIIHYAGPSDFWLMGSIYGASRFFTSFFPSSFHALEPVAWMVRIVPFSL